MNKVEIYNMVVVLIGLPALALLGALLRAAKVAVERWGERNDQEALAADLKMLLDAVDREVLAGADKVRKMKDPGSLLWNPAMRQQVAGEARERALTLFSKQAERLAERGFDVRGAVDTQLEASVEKLRGPEERAVRPSAPAPAPEPSRAEE